MEQLILSKVDAARAVGLSPWGIYRAYRDGELPGFMQRGKLCFDPDAVRAYADELKKAAMQGGPVRKEKHDEC